MQKTWGWSTTGFTLVGKSHEEIQRICLGAGLDGIEASVELFPTTSEAELETIGAGYREAGLQCDSFHLPWPHSPLCDPAGQQVDFFTWNLSPLRGHLQLRVEMLDGLDERALFRLAGHQRGYPEVSSAKHRRAQVKT